MSSTRHFIVSGRVQGVGFRAATRDKARQLHLAGWVRNCGDGRVELIAAGNDTALVQLVDWLNRGPSMAYVERVEQSVKPDAVDLPGVFEIR